MNKERNIFLEKKTIKKALEILFNNFPVNKKPESETVAVVDSVKRVLSKPVFAKLSSPCFHSAAMDGIAVLSKSTFGAHEFSPKQLEIDKDAFYINTGQIIPGNTNAVIMIEHINEKDSGFVEIESPVVPWQNVRKMGEDIVATQLLFPRNHKITPYCIGALFSGGIYFVDVIKKPKILIIPTGREIVAPEENINIKPGQIIETNSYVLGKLAESAGGSYTGNSIIEDDPEKIEKAVKSGISNKYDIILIIGGSSAGSKDFAKQVIEKTGSLLFHGVTMMPGKPVLLGSVKDTPVFGIPGYQVSAIVAFEQFVQPLVLNILKQQRIDPVQIKVHPARKIPSKIGVTEFLRVKLGRVGKKIVATPLKKSAGCITSLTEASGIIKITNNAEGISADTPVFANLLKPLNLVENTIVIAGSHDNTIDLLSDLIKEKDNSISVSSNHIGSMGGLMAIKKGVAHIAGSHLLDTSNGSYNISYIKKYLPDINVVIVNLALRDQGLIIARGNPKKIKSIKDLAREDICFINRQAGSGTRILLDYKLKNAGISSGVICGYSSEEYTHMSVAVAVLSKAADAGLGIYAAAKALDLDFIPVITEKYDLVIPEIFFNDKKIQILIEIINSKKFKNKVLHLGGYSTEKTGTCFKCITSSALTAT